MTSTETQEPVTATDVVRGLESLAILRRPPKFTEAQLGLFLSTLTSAKVTRGEFDAALVAVAEKHTFYPPPAAILEQVRTHRAHEAEVERRRSQRSRPKPPQSSVSILALWEEHKARAKTSEEGQSAVAKEEN